VSRGSGFKLALLASIVVLSFSAVGLTAVIKIRGYFLTKLPIEAEKKMHTLPAEYPAWVRLGPDQVMSIEAEEELGTHNHLSRKYVEREPADPLNPQVVDIHLAYYTGMIDTVPHVPERCFVAGGWEQAGRPRNIRVPLDLEALIPDTTADPEVHGGTILMGRSPTTQGRVRLPRDVEDLAMRVTPFQDENGRTVYAGYFFLANGGTVASANDIRLLAFQLEDDYSYYTKVQFTSGTVGSEEELAAVTASMLDEMLPDIMSRVPDWVEVREGRYPEGRVDRE